MRLDGRYEVFARFFRILAVVGDACGDVRQRLAPLDGDENAPDGRRVPDLDRNRNRRRGGFGRRSFRRAGFAPENDLRRADSRRNRRVAPLRLTRFPPLRATQITQNTQIPPLILLAHVAVFTSLAAFIVFTLVAQTAYFRRFYQTNVDSRRRSSPVDGSATTFYRFIFTILPKRRVFKRFFPLGTPFEPPPSSCRFSKKAYNER